MSIKITGLDAFERQLRDLAGRAKSLHGEHSVPIKELLTPRFLNQCSQFASVDQFFEASGYKIESAEDFEAIPDEPWDAFIRANTSYATWSEMLEAAGTDWAKAKMGF